jgi:hypothetical protein
MSKPVAGDAIASLWFFVILDIKSPFAVEFISKSEEALGVVVPIPAAPVEGKTFVCADKPVHTNKQAITPAV